MKFSIAATITFTFAFGAWAEAPVEIGAFTQCTLAVKHSGEHTGRRMPLKLLSSDDRLVIYGAEVENVKVRIIHDSGRLVHFKRSQTLTFEQEMRFHESLRKVQERHEQASHQRFLEVLGERIQSDERALEKIETNRDRNNRAQNYYRDQLIRNLEENRAEKLMTRPKPFTTPPPEDTDESTYFSVEAMVSDRGEPLDGLFTPMMAKLTLHPMDPGDSIKEFLAAKIKNEVELYNHMVHKDSGRLIWQMGGKDPQGNEYEPETSYVISCTPQT